MNRNQFVLLKEFVEHLLKIGSFCSFGKLITEKKWKE